MPYSTIKEVSQITGIPSYTLRLWEKEFERNLVPSRTKGRRRRYKGEDISVIERIKGLKEQGISLMRIKERLGNTDKESNPDSTRINLLAKRIAEVVRSEVYWFFEREVG